MSADPTQSLIRHLSDDLKPVRRVPPLWLSLCGALALFGAVGVVSVTLLGMREGLSLASLARGSFAGVLVGLTVAAVCGALAALAEGIPGRDRVVGTAGILALLGLGWAAGTALAGWWSHGFASDTTLAMDRMCFERALVVSLAPSAGLVILVVRGWIGRPMRAAALALAAGVAAGAVAVHLGCVLEDPRHLLMGHVGPIVVAVAVAALPVGLLLRRRAR